MQHAEALGIDLELANLPGHKTTDGELALGTDRDDSPVISPAKNRIGPGNRFSIY
jgi:hypothetical protein